MNKTIVCNILKLELLMRWLLTLMENFIVGERMILVSLDSKLVHNHINLL
jgi:hypothetical protein